ncbi:pyroglutamyl-peptidase I [Timonella senegalensis]|uniref:pyroglutamyl-peptidase I n=1 Tax=Timonella senegalensis TaxID=1465825 RepID=UPI0028AEE5F5|nr:pyroglutamyl-peptidase I [Timonella senegalensis]
MTTRVLLTGFEPFDGASSNPSIDAVELLADEGLPAIDIVGRALPVEFAAGAQRLRELIAQCEPDVVVCVGLASGRNEVSVERVAVNVADARIPDNGGARPVDEELVAGGPAAYFSTLPIKSAVLAARAAGVAAGISNTAGTYVCNAAMYHALDATQGSGTRAGFIHVPDVYAQDSALSLEDVVTALRAIVTASAEVRSDAVHPMGAEH